MTSPQTRAFACALLAGATLGLATTNAHAVSATWELKGTITVSQFAPGPDTPNIPVGTPFRLLVTFDTAEPFTTRSSSDGRPGIRYQYFGAPSLRFALYAGPDCNPCTPALIPARNLVFVRDNFADPLRNPPPDAAYDGYTFGMDPDPADGNYEWQVIFREQSAVLDLVSVTGPTPQPLPAVPDTRLTQMAESVFNINNNVNGDVLSGRIETVGTPTYGTAYLLTGRDCSYPDFATDQYGNPILRFDDCASSARPGFFNRFIEEGGGPGQGDFSRTINIDFPTFSTTVPAPMGFLGTVFGAATFGGPSALPVVKASSYPTDVARNNGNVQAYQQYRYRGSVRTDMPLVADLTYHVLDNLVMPSNPNPGVTDQSIYPGYGGISATLAIIDGGLVSAADMAAAGFAHRTCGSESSVVRADGTPWPAGAIMGTATYGSGRGESGAQARLINVVRCATGTEARNDDGTVASGAPVSLAPNQDFYVVSTLQTPSRGRWQQAANTSPTPAANGYADASGTLRVTIDPQAPPEVIQQILSNVAPACTDCTFEPDFRVDIKPGSGDNAINVNSEGVIPVAVFSGANATVFDIDVGTLQLGDLGLRRNKMGQPLCSFEDVNLDGITDLMCHFQNSAANWTPGQTAALVTGKLKNGASVIASDSIRLVP
jgi:hypothetical protein